MTQPANTDSLDWIDILWKRTNRTGRYYEKPIKLTEFREAIEQHALEAEGRGRLKAVNMFKEWADKTELTYNEMMQTQLDELKTLQATKPMKDGDAAN